MQVQNVGASPATTLVSPQDTAVKPQPKSEAAIAASLDQASDEQELPISREQLQVAVKRVNDVIKPMETGLEFSIDEDTSLKIVKVLDMQTKDIIRQFPSEEILRIAKSIDRLQGLLVRDKA